MSAWKKQQLDKLRRTLCVRIPSKLKIKKNLSKHRLNLETRGGRRWKSSWARQSVFNRQNSSAFRSTGALELSARQKSPQIANSPRRQSKAFSQGYIFIKTVPSFSPLHPRFRESKARCCVFTNGNGISQHSKKFKLKINCTRLLEAMCLFVSLDLLGNLFASDSLKIEC